MAFRVVWTDAAIEDLREAVRFIALDKPAAAESVGHEIIRCVGVEAGVRESSP